MKNFFKVICFLVLSNTLASMCWAQTTGTFPLLDKMVTPLPVSDSAGRGAAAGATKDAEALKKQAAQFFLLSLSFRKTFSILDQNYFECDRKPDPFIDIFVDANQNYLTAEKIFDVSQSPQRAEEVAKKMTDKYLWGTAKLSDLRSTHDTLKKNAGKYPEIKLKKTYIDIIDKPAGRMVTGINNVKKSVRDANKEKKEKNKDKKETDKEKLGKFTDRDRIITIVEPFIMVKNKVDVIGLAEEEDKRIWFAQQNAIAAAAQVLYFKVELEKLAELATLINSFDTLDEGKLFGRHYKYKVPVTGVNDLNEDILINGQLWNVYNRLIALQQQIKLAHLQLSATASIEESDPVYESVITNDRTAGFENDDPLPEAYAGDSIYADPSWENMGGGGGGGGGDGGSDDPDVEEESESEECKVTLNIFFDYDYADLAGFSFSMNDKGVGIKKPTEPPPYDYSTAQGEFECYEEVYIKLVGSGEYSGIQWEDWVDLSDKDYDYTIPPGY